ncbi:PREDICTED: uncharacterized protein LOC109585179 [Amphimedon queenslandica]|uniref:Uncharacterized protein n=1 Tax=Amphimedon queenslandica TaxID=400682 RepID=A0AAN0JIX9_AMPQE|nr:PREDICTED: uncharacterized protein LOC109585179 [Amphimedon queenslandica]|eukprot:XP_019856722.1 PREDICTED: uncharacterized protein LOC109585179 [Amphimedon queenslandica]
MSGQWSYPGQFPPQAQWQQGGGSVGGMGQQQQYMMRPGGPIQMGGAQGITPGLPQGMGVAQGMQGMGVAQPRYPGMPYQPVNSMTGTVLMNSYTYMCVQL